VSPNTGIESDIQCTETMNFDLHAHRKYGYSVGRRGGERVNV